MGVDRPYFMGSLQAFMVSLLADDQWSSSIPSPLQPWLVEASS